MLLELRREGIAGVWGVWGEIGFPGDDEVDVEVPPIIGGTLGSCLLEDVDDRCRSRDDDMESESAVFESFIR